MSNMREETLDTKIIWACVNFGVMIHEPVDVGDMIQSKIADGVLHEICLISNLDIPNIGEKD